MGMITLNLRPFSVTVCTFGTSPLITLVSYPNLSDENRKDESEMVPALTVRSLFRYDRILFGDGFHYQLFQSCIMPIEDEYLIIEHQFDT